MISGRTEGSGSLAIDSYEFLIEGDSEWTLYHGLAPRALFATVTIENEVFIIGGTHNPDTAVVTGRLVEKLDKTLKTWSRVNYMDWYLANHAASVVDSLDLLNICIG